MKFANGLIIAVFILVFVNCSKFNPDIQFRVAGELTEAGKFKEAQTILKKIIKTSKGKELYFIAQSRLAENYYYLNDFENATIMSENLLKTDLRKYDPRIKLAAQMVLLSIERKRTILKE